MNAEFGAHLEAWVELLGQGLLHFLWQGLLIAVIYQLARTALRRSGPAAQVACGHAAFALFALAPCLTVWVLARAEATQAIPVVQAWTSQALAQIADAGWDEPIDLLPPLWLVVALWGGGVLVLAGRNLWAWRCDARLAAAARPADAPLARIAAQLAARLDLRTVPELRELVGLVTPCLVGWLRPVVLMPMGLALRLPAAQLEALLLHELAHLRRADYLANLLQTAVETLLFYHPAVHWVGRQVRADRERACDDLVLAARVDPIAYARALATLELNRHLASAPSVAVAATGGLLLGRIERILGASADEHRAGRLRASAGGLPALIVLGCALALLGWFAPHSDRSVVRLAVELAALRLPDPSHRLALPALEASLPAPRVPIFELPALPAPTQAVESDSAPIAAGAERLSEVAAATSRAAAEPAPNADAATDTFADRSAAETANLPGPQSPAVAAVAIARAEPRLLFGAPTVYPRRARIDGQEGSVVLSFALGRDGRPEDVRIESASPAGFFEAAAREALRASRFEYRSEHAGQTFHRQFDFKLASAEEEIETGDRSGRCVPPLGTRICRSR
jgi:bla regulator protein blaR1